MLLGSLEGRRLLSSYYLDPSGNDANDGLTPQTAWATTARASVAGFQAGDSLLLAGGRFFNGTLRFDAGDAGSPAAPILVGSYGTGRATIVAGNADGLSFFNTSGFVVTDLNILGSGQTPATFNGIEFETSFAGDVKLPFVRVRNVDVSGFGRYGISVGGSTGKSGFEDVRIEYADVHDNTLGGIETHGVFSGTATGYANRNVYVGHCTVHHNPGYAGSPNHSGDGIVVSDADGVLIERNVAYENGARNTHVGGPVGIWVWDVNGAVIQFNESHHNRTNSTADGGGFDFDGGVTNSLMQYNYSHDNEGAGYGIYQFAGARPFHHNTVRYNVSADDARKGSYGAIDFWNGNGRNGISEVDVYNNTVYVSPSAGGAPKALRFISGTTNVRLRNNIFQTTGGVTVAEIQAKQSGLLLQGNDYWSSGAPFRLKDFAKTYSSVLAWSNATGKERVGSTYVGRQVDPLLTAPSAAPTLGNADLLEMHLGAFRLRADSPLRDAGLNLWTAFGTDPGRRDLFGTALPDSSTAAAFFRYDVGAHEYA